MDDTYTVDKGRRGWVITQATPAGKTYRHYGPNLNPWTTKRAALAARDLIIAGRESIEQYQADEAARLAAAVADRGMVEVAFLDLQPGDVYTIRPYTGPERTVTRVNDLGNGAAMVYHEPDPADPDDLGHLLFVPQTNPIAPRWAAVYARRAAS